MTMKRIINAITVFSLFMSTGNSIALCYVLYHLKNGVKIVPDNMNEVEFYIAVLAGIVVTITLALKIYYDTKG